MHSVHFTVYADYFLSVALCNDISLQRGRFRAQISSLMYPKIQDLEPDLQNILRFVISFS